jgi:uncharacterized RDD family membrane protein YckC
MIPSMQGDYRIATPENVSFGYQIAGIASRFLAAFVDHLVIFTVWFVLLFAAIALMGSGLLPALDSLWIFVILGALLFFMLSGYFILFEMLWGGQSPGKRLVGLRVLHADGTPLTLVDSLVRNLVRWIDFLPVYYGVGLIAMFFSRESRRLGDLAAGTLVIRERREVTLDSLLAAASRAPRTQPAERVAPAVPAVDTRSLDTLPPDERPPAAAPERAPLEALAGSLAPGEPPLAVERLTADEIDLVTEYLRRRAGLLDRRALGREIARAIALRLGEHETEFTPAGARAFLERVAAASAQQPR